MYSNSTESFFNTGDQFMALHFMKTGALAAALKRRAVEPVKKVKFLPVYTVLKDI